MKISSSAYFAVESLVRLAAYDAKRPCSVEALSHSVGCSESFTEQLTTDVNGTAGAAPRTNTQRSNDTVQSCEEGVMTFIAENLAVTTSTDGNIFRRSLYGFGSTFKSSPSGGFRPPIKSWQQHWS